MRKIKDTEQNLIKRLYYNNINISRKASVSVQKRPIREVTDLNTKLTELDNSLNMNDIINQINKFPKNDRKTVLKKILRKHYFSQDKF
jgi:hypothetical protein